MTSIYNFVYEMLTTKVKKNRGIIYKYTSGQYLFYRLKYESGNFLSEVPFRMLLMYLPDEFNGVDYVENVQEEIYRGS